MATLSHFEPLVGVVDGVNTVFTVTTPTYIAGTTTLFVRGLIRRIDNDDGWIETDPSTGTVTLKEAPLTDDDVQMHWLEQTTAPANEITPMSGCLDAQGVLHGAIQAITLSGFIPS